MLYDSMCPLWCHAGAISFLAIFNTCIKYDELNMDLGGYDLVLSAMEAYPTAPDVQHYGVLMIYNVTTIEGKCLPALRVRPNLARLLKTAVANHRAHRGGEIVSLVTSIMEFLKL